MTCRNYHITVAQYLRVSIYNLVFGIKLHIHYSQPEHHATYCYLSIDRCDVLCPSTCKLNLYPYLHSTTRVIVNYNRTQAKIMNSITIRAVTALFAFGLLTGCAATTRTLDPDVEKHYDASYDFSDKKQIVQTLTDSLLSSPGVVTEPEKPVIIVYGVDNETSEHISTSGITDDIRLALIKSGQYRFLNRKQRDNLLEETDYQYAGFVPPEQRVTEGRQLGADYILSGTLRSISKKQPRQFRLNKRTLIYYAMNLELTNLQTGEISWADNVEIAREASRPIIGW